jgi:hypothetical protein
MAVIKSITEAVFDIEVAFTSFDAKVILTHVQGTQLKVDWDYKLPETLLDYAEPIEKKLYRYIPEGGNINADTITIFGSEIGYEEGA